MRRVVVESPYAGDLERNGRYLDACLVYCFSRNESPYASHAIGPRALKDDVPEQRKQGIEAGFAWADVADAVVFYVDLGWSNGMSRALERHQADGRTIEQRRLPGWSENE
jgi:hypothetical protein